MSLAGVDVAVAEPAGVEWRLGTRLTFRFLVAYFSLYILTTQMLQAMIPSPVPRFPPVERFPPMLPLLIWTAKHVFGIAETPVVLSGSGDKDLNWIAAAWLLAIAAIATAAWSFVDRRRPAYHALFAWFQVFMRFALGATKEADENEAEGFEHRHDRGTWLWTTNPRMRR